MKMSQVFRGRYDPFFRKTINLSLFCIIFLSVASVYPVPIGNLGESESQANHVNFSKDLVRSEVDFSQTYLASLNKNFYKKYLRRFEKKKLRPNSKTFTNSIGMKFVLIPSGDFLMGCTHGDSQCDDDETPRHKVKITKAFYMTQYEVTQKQWKKIMGNNPSYFKGDNLPVERVSWDDAKRFINKLNKKEHRRNYRLPTEAEWEYAARGNQHGSRWSAQKKYYWGNKFNKRYAWYWGNSNKRTHVVGKKYPNGFGLYDMLGNVWEWCEDSYDEYYYLKSPTKNPVNKKFYNYKVLRGGSWFNNSKYLRASNRVKINSNLRISDDGFRVVLAIK